MPHLATDRITRGLRWTGTGLLVAGAVVIVAGIGWTRSADALVTASAVAVLAFGLPGAAVFALALWLEHTVERLERPARGRPFKASALGGKPNPFREPLRRYAGAVAAVGVAWAARAGLNTFIPDQVPFITFFLAVAVSGWLGGFGPAALATLLSLVVSVTVYMPAFTEPSTPNLGRFVVLGLFVFVCLGIAAMTAALHAALERSQHLALETQRQQALIDTREDRFRSLAEYLPTPAWMTDPTGACTYCNPAWLRWRGRSLEQELGQGWEEAVHPDDLPRRRQVHADASAQHSAFTLTYRLRGADGAFHPVREQGAARFGSDGTFAGYVGACSDDLSQ